MQILLFAGVVTFLFISPYLERAHHLRAISRLDPDEWGPHLNVLCSLDPGQRMLESHLATSPEGRRARLIPLLKERGCPERVYTVAIEAPPEAR
ncbi:MAG: hypothetical protein CMH57_01965 [Myxococcales bacterium]|nr:hypothetical protein [Myxococcales bacterium]